MLLYPELDSGGALGRLVLWLLLKLRSRKSLVQSRGRRRNGRRELAIRLLDRLTEPAANFRQREGVQEAMRETEAVTSGEEAARNGVMCGKAAPLF